MKTRGDFALASDYFQYHLENFRELGGTHPDQYDALKTRYYRALTLEQGEERNAAKMHRWHGGMSN